MATPENISTALQRIATVRESGAEVLDLGDLSLERLPDELGSLTEVRVLALGSYCPIVQNGALTWEWDPTRVETVCLADISVLAELNQLKNLHLGACPNLTDISPLAELNQLQSLDLGACSNLTDIMPLAELNQLQSLDLSFCEELTDITPLAKLNQLQNLNLDDCPNLTDITPLAKLSQLQKLYLRFCKKLIDITPLAELNQLQSLDLRFCRKLTDITPLAELNQLQNLNLGDCPNLTDITPLAELKQLQSLYLNNCEKLTDQGVRAFFADAVSFLQLHRLWLISTQIGDRGIQTLAEAAKRGDFPQLQWLHLSETRVSNKGVRALAEAAKRGAFLQLESLALGHTEVTDEGVYALAEAGKQQAFPQLQSLWLDHTGVSDEGARALAEVWRDHGFPQLENLNLDRTQVIDVLPEVLATNDARRILRTILEGVFLHQARIAFLGMGRVGKTSLYRRLFLKKIADERNPPDPTVDFDLIQPEQVRWKPRLSSSANQRGTPIEPRVWDFGGQLVLHGVHESFLTPDRRTIYLVVMAADRVPQRDKDRNGHEAGNGLDYWLRTIASFAGSDAPVVVTITKCDRYATGQSRKVDSLLCPENPQDERPLHQRQSDELRQRCGAGVTAIIDGCSATKRSKPIKPLRKAIEQAMAKLSAIKDQKVESEFIDLMNHVRQQMSGIALASVPKYRQWCKSVKIEDEDAQDTHLRVLHELGIVFYFGRTPFEQHQIKQERHAADDSERWLEPYPSGQHRTMKAPLDPLLQQYLINPIWFKQPLYEIITRSERDHPWMSRDEIIQAIRAVENRLYRSAVQAFKRHRQGDEVILAALKRIELCHHDEHRDEYFFPGGLPLDGTPFLPEWSKSAGQEYGPIDRCRLTWDFLRESAVHRLMVKWYPQIVDSKHWRFGMVVADYSCQAAVSANPDDGTVQIDMHGGTSSNRQILYQVLRRDLVKDYVGQEPKEEKTLWANVQTEKASETPPARPRRQNLLETHSTPDLSCDESRQEIGVTDDQLLTWFSRDILEIHLTNLQTFWCVGVIDDDGIQGSQRAMSLEDVAKELETNWTTIPFLFHSESHLGNVIRKLQNLFSKTPFEPVAWSNNEQDYNLRSKGVGTVTKDIYWTARGRKAWLYVSRLLPLIKGQVDIQRKPKPDTQQPG
jgi:GTPase SAR1 family protein